MRMPIYAAATTLALALGYIAFPFYTAWSIREAIQAGRADYLETKIEWEGVRASLRESLTRIALDTPEDPAGSPTAASPLSPNKPGFWQRVKNSLGQRAVDNIVDNYVTPEGLPQLFGARQLYRNHIGGDPNAGLSWRERVAGFWSRLKRAEFKDPATFEIEMADRNDPTRHYVGLLRLRGLEWKLTELRVRAIRNT